MAGAGVRLFSAGSQLLASQINTYLMDQTVAYFADSAARDAAFGGVGEPTLSPGRVCYLFSDNKLYLYGNDNQWNEIGAQLDDSEVTTAKINNLAVTTAKLADNSVTSAKIVDGTIVNADINTSAAIELSKLAVATIDEKSANYTLVLTDATKFIKMSVGTANTVTVPTNASVAFPIGTQIHIIQYGTGKTQVAGAGVVIYSTPGNFLRAQYSSATLLKCDTNIWMLMGDLSAS
jgi:hypothetical protein